MFGQNRKDERTRLKSGYSLDADGYGTPRMDHEVGLEGVEYMLPLAGTQGGRGPGVATATYYEDNIPVSGLASKPKGLTTVKSMAVLQQGLGSGKLSGNGVRDGNMPTKSYSVNADGTVSYLAPLQMGRQELYELVPFTAVFGLQQKERNLSRAFAGYAADLDVMAASQRALKEEQKPLSEEQKTSRRESSSNLVLDQLEAQSSSLVTVPLLFAVLVAGLSQFLVGYNTGVMNAPESVVFPGHSTFIWSLAVSAFAVGGPFGAMTAGTLADTRGRRGALLINTWTFLVGGAMQSIAIDMATIIVSRFIIGFASGFSSVLVPIYLGELAPPNLRGTLGTITQFALVIGILIADFFAFPFATLDKWRYLFAITPITAALQLLCSPFLLESPRWLLGRDNSSRKARHIIQKLRGLQSEHEIEVEVGHFLSASRAQSNTEGEGNEKITLLGMFSNPNTRVLIISALVLQMGQQLCGINAVFYYSTGFFEGIIKSPLVGTTIVGAVNVVATYGALLLMDKCGRRTLLLWSSGGMFICCIIIVMALKDMFDHVVALLAVNAYVTFFEFGLGPIPWLIVAEMFDAKYVATAMSAASQLNWACNFIVGLVFPFMDKYLQEYSFVPFAIVLLAIFIFSLAILPETRGLTPAELQAALMKKNAAMVYHNINIQEVNTPIDMQWRVAMEQLRQDEERSMMSGTYDYGFQPIDGAGGNVYESQRFGGGGGGTSDWKSRMGA